MSDNSASGSSGLASERSTTAALALLATAAVLSTLVYWLFYSRVYNLLDLYNQPLFDLYRRTQKVPDARWWLVLAFVIQGSLYWLGWRAAQRARGRAAWAIILGGALASGIVLLFMFPYGAADMFDYIVHGRILSKHGGNPFFQVGAAFPDDPFVAYMGWRTYPSTYGPIWVLLSGAAAWLAGDGIVANVLVFKLLSGVFVFASVGVVAAILRRHAPERALAGALALAWNPVVLYETFGNGHNDIAMIFWMVAAAWCITRRRFTLAVLALVVGTLFKYLPILLLPAAGLIALRELPGNRARLRFVLSAGLGTLALVVLAYLPFWQWPGMFTIMRRANLFTTSLPAALYAWLQPIWGRAQAAELLSFSAAALTGLYALWQGIRAWRDRSWRSFPQAAFRVMVFYLLFTCLWFQEWYTIWPVALAAVLVLDQAVFLAALLNYAALTKPFVFGPMVLWIRPLPPDTWRELRLGPAVLALPWLYLLFLFVRRRWTHRGLEQAVESGSHGAGRDAARRDVESGSPAAGREHGSRNPVREA